MRTASVGGVLLVLTCLLGCFGGGGNPLDTVEGRKTLTKEAGEIAALAYLAAAKPTEEETTAVKSIVVQIANSLTSYKEGGFITALPEIEKVIDDNLPGEDKRALRTICKKAANILMEELDKVFERHPDWKTLSAEIAGLTAAFFEGAVEGLTKYRQKAAA